MFYKVVATAAVFALGYYFGREIERTAPFREELRKEREGQIIDAEEAEVEEKPTKTQPDSN